MDFGGRTVLFQSLVGSHNYNLNTETSDKDYKIFLLPNFDDLYSGKKFSKAYVGDTEDYDVHDIRELSNLFWKSNVNFLEVLFSKEIIINPALNFQIHNLLVDLFAKKNDIASMNLPYLYNACIGMYKTKSNIVLNGIGDKDLIDKYGYDTKSAMHSIRILDFLRRFCDSGFTDFEHAIRYNEDNIYSDILLTLKSGKIYFSDYLTLSNELFLHVQDKYADMYKNCTSNEQTKEEMIKSGKATGKQIEIFKDEKSLGIFPSCNELARQSEELFGVKLSNVCISAVCRGKQNTHRGYTFHYVTKDNLIK